MVEQSRNLFIVGAVLILVFFLWMWDRSNLARKIKEVRWRAKEELVEKEVRLKLLEEKMRSAQKEQAALPGAGKEALSRQALNTQEEAIDKELAQMQRLYVEEEHLRQEAQRKGGSR